MIYQLMYFSLAEDGLSEAHVDAIVTTSHERNPIYGISSFLTFNGAEFLQFIEGPEQTVRELVDNISRDSRNHSLIVLQTAFVAERAFPDWAMQCLHPAPCRGQHSVMETVAEDIQHAVSGLANNFRTAYLNYLRG